MPTPIQVPQDRPEVEARHLHQVALAHLGHAADPAASPSAGLQRMGERAFDPLVRSRWERLAPSAAQRRRLTVHRGLPRCRLSVQRRLCTRLGSLTYVVGANGIAATSASASALW